MKCAESCTTKNDPRKRRKGNGQWSAGALVKEGRWWKCEMCGETNPTPDEIRARARELREQWTDDEKQRRRTFFYREEGDEHCASRADWSEYKQNHLPIEGEFDDHGSEYPGP